MRLIHQLDASDCGAACLAMIADHYNSSRSLAHIRELAGTDQTGTNLAGLVKAGEALGFSTRALKGSREAFSRNMNFPLIAHLMIQRGEETVPHYVVIAGIKKNVVHVFDPFEGVVKHHLADFLNMWSGYAVFLTPKEDFRPERHKKGLFGRFFPVLRPFVGLLGFVAGASLILVFFGVVGSFYFRYLIDEILPSRSELTLHVVSTGVVLLTLLQVLMEAVRKQILLYFSLKVDNSIIYAYFQHLVRLPLSFFDARMSGDLISRLGDVQSIRVALSDASLTIVMDSLMVIAVGVVLVIQSPTLFFSAVVSVPLISLTVWTFSRLFSENYKKLMTDGSAVHANLVETLSGISTIKAFNAENKVIETFDEKQSKVIWSGFRLGGLENKQGIIVGLINGWSSNLIFWVGGALILHDTLSLGQVVSFSVLLGFFLGPLQRLVNLQPNLQQAVIAAERVGEIFDIAVESQNQKARLKPTPLSGPIEIRDLCFRYGTRKQALININLTIPAGNQVAFVGLSGSGKTTLMKLLLKFYTPESGQILFGGNNLADVDTEHLRANVGYVPQEVFLFSGTIAENLALGKPGATSEMLLDAARRAGAFSFIDALPERFETPLTERGGSLSGGERQRLVLARALVGNPHLIIFDEATSNLDSVSERKILETLKTLRGEHCTILIIAHRLPTIIDSDVIHVFSEGTIVESGNHESLLKSGALYRTLWSEGSL